MAFLLIQAADNPYFNAAFACAANRSNIHDDVLLLYDITRKNVSAAIKVSVSELVDFFKKLHVVFKIIIKLHVLLLPQNCNH